MVESCEVLPQSLTLNAELHVEASEVTSVLAALGIELEKVEMKKLHTFSDDLADDSRFGAWLEKMPESAREQIKSEAWDRSQISRFLAMPDIDKEHLIREVAAENSGVRV